MEGEKSVEPSSSGKRLDMLVPIGQPFRPKHLKTNLDRLVRPARGRRSSTRSDRRGHYTFSRRASGWRDDIALDATFRQAAPYQVRRPKDSLALNITEEDLMRKIRVRKVRNLVLFVMDASWSMAAAERMVVTKAAVMSLLIDAYQKRDRVGLITFQREEARLVLPPTNSVSLAARLLPGLTVGGMTPLSRGLYLAYRVMRLETLKDPKVMPLMIILTDGAGNVSMGSLSPQEEAMEVAHLIKGSQIHAIVINTESEAYDKGLAQKLALGLGGECYSLAELGAEGLTERVLAVVNGGSRGP